jgi:pyruvate formate-lyase/glycerol dehydratase family glycyl radical enzyme
MNAYTNLAPASRIKEEHLPETEPAFRKPNDRIAAIKAALFASPYSLCLERPRLLLRFQKSTSGRLSKKDHPLVKRAKALAYVMSERQPRIYDGERIIGNMTSKRTAANYYPEGGSINILEDLFRLEKRQIPIQLTAKEKLELIQIGLSGLFSSIGGRALLKPGRFIHFIDFFRAKRYFITEEAGIGHQVGGYQNLVHQGLQQPDEIAKICLEKGTLPDGTKLDRDQIAFYQSIRITIKGIRCMASNLADLAEKLAYQPGVSDKRRQELLISADACRQVPYYPARTFLEGLQSCWIVHVAMNLEDFEQGMSFGRLDRILLPLFRKDLEQGTITRETATEIMASFQLKTCETLPVYSERIDQYFSGNGVAQGITIGGTDENGEDTTNELSGIVLDAYAQICTREPALHVRVHENTPRWFLDNAVATVQLGCGKPSFFGDTAVVAALEQAGMSKEHARDYAVIGCVEMASQGRTYNSSDAALFNLPLCLELALNQGYCYGQRHFGRRMGAPTKPAEQMHSFDDVVDAFRSQVEHAVAEMVKVIGWLEATYRIYRPTPVNSMITEGCIDKGKDVTWGGALYDLTSIQVAGLADAGDSLYAIQQLIFHQKRFTLKELLNILKTDYQYHHALQQELLHQFPRYGNGIADVDQMTQLAADVFSNAITAHRNSRGGRYIPGIYSMTCHIAFGRLTGALPNGRGSGQRMSNGLSPADGADRKGPTAVLRSAASLDSRKWSNCCALNLKFDRKTVAGKAGCSALANLFTTYFDQGGMQVQANVLDADMLRAAKQNPAEYPGIVVRVAGYCAYFNDLQPSVQDEIIERTAHGIG